MTRLPQRGTEGACQCPDCREHDATVAATEGCDMLVTHKDGRAVYAKQGDSYEALFGPGVSLDDVLLLEERKLLGEWRTCYDARRYGEGFVADE